MIVIEITMNLPCGAIVEFDSASGISYRCTRCDAIVRSVAMPETCVEIIEAGKIVKRLKGENENKFTNW